MNPVLRTYVGISNWFWPIVIGIAWAVAALVIVIWAATTTTAVAEYRAAGGGGALLIGAGLVYAFIRPRRAFFLLAMAGSLAVAVAALVMREPFWLIGIPWFAFMPVIFSPDPHGVFR